MDKATFDQYLEMGQMIKSGQFDRETLQAIIEKRFTVNGVTHVTDPTDHYTVHVDYATLPSMKALEKQFSGKDSVSVLFDGREWETHESCEGMDETPGDREMLVKHFRVDMTSDAVIAWAKDNGYRVATHREAVAFAAKNPELQRQFWIVALGSSALSGDDRCVTMLGSDGRGRILRDYWFNHEWYNGDRFLLVRK